MVRSLLLAAILAAAPCAAPASVAASTTSPASAAATTSSNASAATVEPGLVGTWRLVKFEDHYKSGRVDRPYGEHPRGYFTYDPTGHLSIHIMRNPPLARFASGDSDIVTDTEKAKAFDAYVGYFGTYRVDKAAGVLHHQVEGALNSIYTDTDQLRPYRLNGDVLIIEVTDEKSGDRYYRELHRVR
jgi:hypothetical protein